MKEIYINTDDYNSDSIRTIQGNNNAEEYKIYLQYDNEKIDLTNKTVNLGFLKIGSTEGDIIENLNVTDPKNGEITLKITNKLSKKNGTYSCQLAILGEGDFLEHTATFTLTVENNIFSDITKAIADSKDFTYLENILDKASKLSEKLKENTSSATNANSNLESNITEANNINSKLLENTSTATSLNKNLESNIDLAKEVKDTIKDLDTKNIEATEKIETLTGLNAKAQELSDNINQALPLNSELVKNTEEAKAANTNLLAANQEATTKNTELQASLEKTKEFINGLDGSQNIPQIRMDVTELQNGLKSNQALAYTGSSINAENTLEGRTEGMRIGGRTLVNLVSNTPAKNASNVQIEKLLKSEMFKVGTTYTVNIPNRNNKPIIIVVKTKDGVTKNINLSSTTNTFTVEEDYPIVFRLTLHTTNGWDVNNDLTNADKSVIIEGNNIIIDNYFEGLKSFGEAEKVGDKYKISILSSNKNLFNLNEIGKNFNYKEIENGFEISNTEDVPYPYANIKKYMFLKKGTYTFSYSGEGTGFVNVAIRSKVNSDSYSGDIKPNIPKTFTMDSDKEVVVTFYLQGNITTGTYKNKYTNIQLVEGSKSLNYEPYKEDKKDILIKEPLREGDYLYEDNGQVKIYRPTKQYTFTGDENFVFYRQDENLYGVYFNLEDAKKESHTVICNNFKTITEGISSEKEECVLVGAGTGSVYILINKNKLTSQDIAGFKSWLKANPTTIVYQLATPTVEIVENCVDIDLDTYQEKTYFNILNSLQGTLDFKVPSNIGSVVQNMAKEVNNIWDVINNLLVPGILDVNKKVALATIKNNLK
ncbi:BppU family phage baseplate upper protein [Clostridium perfringens]|nr:BppU family phage baseplate upper protein [Clostridium perfringens]MDM0635454.1 BppU family phage baseplate upper protein [Clostridium perfringens]